MINKDGGIEAHLEKNNKKWDPKEFLDSFNKMKIIPPKIFLIELMIQATKRMIPEICQRNWAMLMPKSKNKFFITSDNPGFLYNSNNNDKDWIPGLKDKNTDMIFPLLPNMCLYASNKFPEDIVEISDNDVINLNIKIKENCNKYFFSKYNNHDLVFEN